MGNRKERRRLASMSGSGRRVKLDLFAEPSGGDLGGSAEQVGGEVHSKPESGLLPNSPSSSSDQQPENPLLLLGQYSDEELDDGSSKNHSGASVENSSRQNNDEVKSELEQNLDIKGVHKPTAQDLNQKGEDSIPNTLDGDQTVEDSNDSKNGDPTPGISHTEVDLKENVSLPETSSAQVIGDVGSGWQMVMHEESKSYYYWNTETGETSWEVPDFLAQAAKSTCDPVIASIDEKTENIPVGVQESNGYSNSDVIEGSSNMVPQAIYGDGYHMNNWNVGYNGSEIDMPSHLVNSTEALLERLNSLQGFKDQLQGVGQITKYILELEIRLFDLKSLYSYGSSLLPFWMHSEVHIKRLESAINDEMSMVIKTGEAEASHPFFSKGQINIPKTTGSEVDQVENKEQISSLNYCEGSLKADAVNEDQEIKESAAKNEQVSASGSSTSHMDVGASEQVHGIVRSDQLTTKNDADVEEDVDMDVDMEVEDSNSAENTAVSCPMQTKEFTATEPINDPSSSSLNTSLVSEGTFAVPPPPDDEWIPPPPPDNEEVPPPPPDEPPPEPPYPPLPTYSESGQPLFAEQYSFSYPVSGFNYYGHTVIEAPGGNYYGNADGSQVAVPHLPVYYGTVATMYTENPQVVANPVAPVAYYGLHDGTELTSPVVSAVDSSQFHSGSAPLSSDNLTSDQPRSLNPSGGADNNSSTTQVPSTSATIQAPATIMEKDTVPESLINPVTTTAPTPAASAVTKVQSKGPKKRKIPASSSLRSNKKVSSLVDKWKAAKEELLEDEEESEDTYESLERKRQREIEEWYSQQITSGDAKDNANFQPLGGNWREKVKRRKAQLAREAAQTTPEEPSNGNQKPNLTELSKDLPSGWQAYWDESSKKVYYGNTVTSETSWTRPTK